jgi:predicted GTPase
MVAVAVVQHGTVQAETMSVAQPTDGLELAFSTHPAVKQVLEEQYLEMVLGVVETVVQATQAQVSLEVQELRMSVFHLVK